jgi:hypothetical protein
MGVVLHVSSVNENISIRQLDSLVLVVRVRYAHDARVSLIGHPIRGQSPDVAEFACWPLVHGVSPRPRSCARLDSWGNGDPAADGGVKTGLVKQRPKSRPLANFVQRNRTLHFIQYKTAIEFI